MTGNDTSNKIYCQMTGNDTSNKINCQMTEMTLVIK